MWWDPRNPEERAVRPSVNVLESVYRSYLQELRREEAQLIFGVGTLLDGDGVLVPAVYLSADVVPAGRTSLVADRHVQEPLLAGGNLRELRHYIGDEGIDERTASRLRQMPEDTRAVLTGPPLAASRPIRSTLPPFFTGTAGPRALFDDGSGGMLPGFLTAGHLFASDGEEVLVRSDADPAVFEHAGIVVSHSDPTVVDAELAEVLPGWDGAFVFSEADIGEPVIAPLAEPPRLSDPEAATVFCSKGPTREGMVVGTLTLGGDRARQWSNCWTFGTTDGPLELGDSGSWAIETESGEGLGMFVGGTSWPGSTQLTVMWIQDLRSHLALHPNLTVESIGVSGQAIRW